MITDTDNHFEQYFSAFPKLKEIVSFIQKVSWSEREFGTCSIPNSRAYIHYLRCTHKPWKEGKWETHQKYADLHYILRGEEIIGYANNTRVHPVTNCDEEADVVLYKGNGSRIILHEKEWILLFPQDAHKPAVISKEDCQEESAVKIRKNPDGRALFKLNAFIHVPRERDDKRS